ncbi:MAG: geranylgeranyl reductase family protein [Candidatus Hermodarchaeota archaeon]
MVDYDVIVAGAGTGGAITAYTLAKKGHSVLMIDRKERERIGLKTCGDALGDHHVKKMKEMIGLPDLPKDIVEHEVSGIDLYAPDGVNKLSMIGPSTKGYSFNRHKMGQWLVSLTVKAGAEVMASTRVKRPLFDEGKVSGVRISKEGDDADKDLRARIVVDATGATGMLRRQLPESSLIEKTVAKEDQMVAWRDIYDTPEHEFDTPDILQIHWNQEQTLGGYTWVFPQGPHRVNVGLGVMIIPGYTHPRKIYDSFVKENWSFMKTKLVTIDSSGGTAPIRRPIDTMVDDNFMLVGDAACQVNPIHGGGIGSSMQGGVHAAQVASEALERNDTSMESLWDYNPRYMESYGIKQASLDVFRWFLLNVTNDEINYAFEKGIVKGIDLLSVSITGKMEIGTGEKFKRLLAGIGRVPLLMRVNKVAKLMDQIKDVYSQYPTTPKGLADWKARLAPIYDAAKKA